jgi:hypothetical protein
MESMTKKSEWELLWELNQLLVKQNMGRAVFRPHDEIMLQVRTEYVDQATALLEQVLQSNEKGEDDV